MITNIKEGRPNIPPTIKQISLLLFPGCNAMRRELIRGTHATPRTKFMNLKKLSEQDKVDKNGSLEMTRYIQAEMPYSPGKVVILSSQTHHAPEQYCWVWGT